MRPPLAAVSLPSPLASAAAAVLRPPAAEALRTNDVFGMRVDHACGTPRPAGIWRAAGSAAGHGLLVPGVTRPITRPSGSADPKPEHLAYCSGWAQLVNVRLIDLPTRILTPIAALPALASGVLQGGKNPAAFRHSSQWGRRMRRLDRGIWKHPSCRKALVPP